VTRTALICSPIIAAMLLALAACSQSTAHPDQLGDCRSAYGCNPGLGTPGTGLPSDDGGTTKRDASDGAADGARDGSSDGSSDGGASDAAGD
jgi:hypothetical protein